MALSIGVIYQVRNGWKNDPMAYLGERVLETRRDRWGDVQSRKRVHHLFRNQRTGRVVELKSLNRVLNLGKV